MIERKIVGIIKFYKWLKINESIQSWSEVSERMVNIYLLEIPDISSEIRKRILFNFFEYIKNKKDIF